MAIQTVQIKGQSGLYAEFSNVAIACAKRVMLASEMSQKSQEEIYREFDVAETIESRTSGKNLNSKRSKDATVQLNAMQYFAALRIACAFRSHKFREKIKERIQVQQNMGGGDKWQSS